MSISAQHAVVQLLDLQLHLGPADQASPREEVGFPAKTLIPSPELPVG